LFAAGVHQAEVARQLQVLAQAVNVSQPVTVRAQDPASRTPVADEVLFDGSVVGPTNTNRRPR
jgi:alpha-L-arabinofuranosidase